MTRQEGIDKMKAAARAKPLQLLANSLAIIDAMPKLDDAHRLTRMVLIDVICERCPEAEAAFQAWCESDDMDMSNGVPVILGAVLAAR